MIVHSPAVEDEYVVFHGVSWETYEAILDAIGEYHLRHTYLRGAFEFRRRLCGVSWKDYQKLLAAAGNMSLPHVYDRGELILMSPLQTHDWRKSLIGRMLETLAYEFELPIKSIGSTTIWSSRLKRGFQPDEAYYIKSELRVRGKEEFEPDVDPAPDLVLEVDVTQDSSERMEVFASVNVPEVWRIRGQDLLFFRLGRKGQYKEVKQSRAFAYLGPDDFTRFLAMRDEMDETAVVREFIRWARKKHAQYRRRQRKHPRRKGP
jgi:Uma2 family endonuclease